jgi:hypothetical protein
MRGGVPVGGCVPCEGLRGREAAAGELEDGLAVCGERQRRLGVAVQEAWFGDQGPWIRSIRVWGLGFRGFTGVGVAIEEHGDDVRE